MVYVTAAFFCDRDLGCDFFFDRLAALGHLVRIDDAHECDTLTKLLLEPSYVHTGLAFKRLDAIVSNLDQAGQQRPDFTATVQDDGQTTLIEICAGSLVMLEKQLFVAGR